MSMKVMECLVTIKRVGDRSVIHSLKNLVRTSENCSLEYCDTDHRHNQILLAFVGDPEDVISAAKKIIDVKPYGEQLITSIRLSPLAELNFADCAIYAKELGDKVLVSPSSAVSYFGKAEQYNALRSIDDQHDDERNESLIRIGVSGSASGSDALLSMLNIELRKDLDETLALRRSPQMSFRLKGHWLALGALGKAFMKRMEYSRGWYK